MILQNHFKYQKIKSVLFGKNQDVLNFELGNSIIKNHQNVFTKNTDNYLLKGLNESHTKYGNRFRDIISRRDIGSRR